MATFPGDAFVALPPASAKGHTIFGKNSGRPVNEVQEVIYLAASDHASGTKVKCTYIEIEQVAHTHAILVSKPAWMWGGEMGANEKGVCIGNTAVLTKLCGDEDAKEKLLGQDLVRLGLERSSSAQEALNIITGLLEAHGQGGNCQESASPSVTHHNNFLIVDNKEAWELETAGSIWAAEKVTAGVRNISNCLSIGSKMDASASEFSEADFSSAYSTDSSTSRFEALKNSLPGDSGSIDVVSAMKTLRDESSGINQRSSTTASMVSILTSPDSNVPSIHLITATPNPRHSVFKPFIFTKTIEKFPEYTVAPSSNDHKHKLYVAHERALTTFEAGGDKARQLKEIMTSLENEAVMGIEDILQGEAIPDTEVDELFLDCVETEIKFYN